MLLLTFLFQIEHGMRYNEIVGLFDPARTSLSYEERAARDGLIHLINYRGLGALRYAFSFVLSRFVSFRTGNQLSLLESRRLLKVEFVASIFVDLHMIVSVCAWGQVYIMH